MSVLLTQSFLPQLLRKEVLQLLQHQFQSLLTKCQRLPKAQSLQDNYLSITILPRKLLRLRRIEFNTLQKARNTKYSKIQGLKLRNLDNSKRLSSVVLTLATHMLKNQSHLQLQLPLLLLKLPFLMKKNNTSTSWTKLKQK